MGQALALSPVPAGLQGLGLTRNWGVLAAARALRVQSNLLRQGWGQWGGRGQRAALGGSTKSLWALQPVLPCVNRVSARRGVSLWPWHQAEAPQLPF